MCEEEGCYCGQAFFETRVRVVTPADYAPAAARSIYRRRYHTVREASDGHKEVMDIVMGCIASGHTDEAKTINRLGRVIDLV